MSKAPLSWGSSEQTLGWQIKPPFKVDGAVFYDGFYCRLIKPSGSRSAAALSYNNLYVLSHDRSSLNAIFMLCFTWFIYFNLLCDPGGHWCPLGVPVSQSGSVLITGIPCNHNPFFYFAGIHVKQEDNSLGSLPVSYCVESARMPKANAAYFWSNQRNWDLKRRPLKIYFKWKTVTCGVWSSAF